MGLPTPLFYLLALPGSCLLLLLRRPWEDFWNKPVISSWFKLKCLLWVSIWPCGVKLEPQGAGPAEGTTLPLESPVCGEEGVRQM